MKSHDDETWTTNAGEYSVAHILQTRHGAVPASRVMRPLALRQQWVAVGHASYTVVRLSNIVDKVLPLAVYQGGEQGGTWARCGGRVSSNIASTQR